MYYWTIKKLDSANGPGLRVSLFVSGCRHACPGCFNALSWNFKFGRVFDQEVIDDILQELGKEYVSGLSILWWEPLVPENQSEVRNLISQVRKHYPETSILCYSGYTYEFIREYMCQYLPYTQQILQNIDILIDGRFVQDLLDLKLKFRGSKNQRVIDVPRSLEQNEVVWSSIVDDQASYVFRESPEIEMFAEEIRTFAEK